jgi:ribosomal protein S1
LPDPWEDIKRLYKVGDVFTGAISRLVPFGAFVQVEGGIEGIIPNSELALKRVNNPEEVVSVGQEVEVKVIDLRPDERRLTLSMRQLMTQKEKEREETEFRSYAQARPEAKTTIGDLIGEQLGGLDFGEMKEKPAKKSRSRAKKADVDEAEALAAAQEELEMEESIQAEMEAEVVTQTPEVVAEAETEAPAESAEVAQTPTEEPAEEESKESEA